ncbi:MAG: 16S rRNA (uracil(1498)-N(3))-methyltransferase [Bacteroidaceae bacterium]|nr:16S rRNA (uracil(1498)-N(3))-methyltransferase [Bacteroidaceae bacterium]
MWLFYSPEISVDMELPHDEAQHCIKVLRLKEGEMVSLADGKGTFYDATISTITGKRCLLHIEKEYPQDSLWSGYIHLALAPTKLMDRNEWFVEKAVEIGVDEISFIKTAHSERDVIKMERIEKIAISAMKQSKKAVLPKINPMVKFSDFISAHKDGDCFIAHCEEDKKLELKNSVVRGNRSLVLIGPEGDFSSSEIDMALKAGYKGVSLGPSRLRTETAALAAVHIMNLVNQID